MWNKWINNFNKIIQQNSSKEIDQSIFFYNVVAMIWGISFMLKTVNFYPRLMVLWTISCPNWSQNEKNEKQGKKEDRREDGCQFIQFNPILSNSSKKELWIVWNEGKERRQGRCFVMMMIERRWVSDFLFYFLLAYTVLGFVTFFGNMEAKNQKVPSFLTFGWFITL